ncbi:hypothetical protein [Homoserinibacter sp. YIM 151385]|uniref:hypothetical protein n=1 Tax=Homoserinibacter sp. YIM 151385 TaxID=2985506 RepID=UPI0022EFFA1D|nr:hypothetical protein [Homoserinibacter sp. YIM 151385]WBU39088.1 hypothetical protein OF852_05795 [Homoserinibacter sp. YIM 151385]
MKVAAFVIAMILFVGALLLFGYAIDAAAPLQFLMFGGGIIAVSLSLVIPFHLLEKLD